MSSFTSPDSNIIPSSSRRGGSVLRSKTKMMQGLKPFSCEQLRDYLEEKEDQNTATLLLDCRSFLSFNESHISSAVNAYCPSIVRRRSRGKLPLHVLLSSADVRDKLNRGYYGVVVVYDDNGSGPKENEDFSALRLISRCLQQQQDGTTCRNTYYLQGGFQRFMQKHPHLCVTPHCSYRSTSSTSHSTVALMPQSCLSPSLTSSVPKLMSSATIQLQHPNCGNIFYEQGDPVEILPHLYLGSAFHAANLSTLDRLGITALLNISRTSPTLVDAKFVYKNIPVDDSGSADISSWFADTAKFIDGVEASKSKVLVHCHAGISRSATICLAYLMHSQQMKLEEAYEYVRKRRNIISPNFNFMNQLLKYEAELFPAAVMPLRGIYSWSKSAASCSKDSSRNLVSVREPAEPCIGTSQRFVFDLAVVENCCSRVSSSSPLFSPLHTNITTVLSPS